MKSANSCRGVRGGGVLREGGRWGVVEGIHSRAGCGNPCPTDYLRARQRGVGLACGRGGGFSPAVAGPMTGRQEATHWPQWRDQ